MGEYCPVGRQGQHLELHWYFFTYKFLLLHIYIICMWFRVKYYILQLPIDVGYCLLWPIVAYNYLSALQPTVLQWI